MNPIRKRKLINQLKRSLNSQENSDKPYFEKDLNQFYELLKDLSEKEIISLFKDHYLSYSISLNSSVYENLSDKHKEVAERIEYILVKNNLKDFKYTAIFNIEIWQDYISKYPNALLHYEGTMTPEIKTKLIELIHNNPDLIYEYSGSDEDIISEAFREDSKIIIKLNDINYRFYYNKNFFIKYIEQYGKDQIEHIANEVLETLNFSSSIYLDYNDVIDVWDTIISKNYVNDDFIKNVINEETLKNILIHFQYSDNSQFLNSLVKSSIFKKMITLFEYSEPLDFYAKDYDAILTILIDIYKVNPSFLANVTCRSLNILTSTTQVLSNSESIKEKIKNVQTQAKLFIDFFYKLGTITKEDILYACALEYVKDKEEIFEYINLLNIELSKEDIINIPYFYNNYHKKIEFYEEDFRKHSYLAQHDKIVSETLDKGIDITPYIVIVPGEGNYINCLTEQTIKKACLINKDFAQKQFIDGNWHKLIGIKNDETSLQIFTEKQLKIIECYKEIIDGNLRNEFKKYIMEHMDVLSIPQIELCSKVLQRLLYSNSIELYSFRDSIASQLLNSKKPLEELKKLEEIFVSNNLPLFAKMYKCFCLLYPNLEYERGEDAKLFDFSDDSRMAPQLHDSFLENIGSKVVSNTDKRFLIIYNDLLRIAIKSGSRDLLDYLNNLEKGNDLFFILTNSNITYESLDEENKRILDIFLSHLITLYKNTKKGKDMSDIFDGLPVKNKLEILMRLFKTNNRYDIKDRIVRSFAFQAGYKSFDELKEAVLKSVKEADEKNRIVGKKLENGEVFQFEENDFVRGIGNFEALEGSLQNGNVSKDHLSVFRELSESNTTPLDIDITLVTKTDSIYNAIKDTPTGFGFGNIFIIIKKDNPNLNISRNKDGNITSTSYDASKIEMFGTNTSLGGYETHWGARTGIALTDIDYILYKKDLTINDEKPYDEAGNVNYLNSIKKPYEDLAVIKFSIAKNGYYIPVIDFSGKLIFTVKEYEELRSKMAGLSYYGVDNYEFSPTMVSEDAKIICEELEKNRQETFLKEQKIIDKIKEALYEYGFSDVKFTLDTNLDYNVAELFNTGSTDRGNNMIGAGDFDFILRVDREILFNPEKLNALRQKLADILGIKVLPSGRDIKHQIIEIDGEQLELDISFVQKTNKILYSTDLALKDRMSSIQKISSEQEKIDGFSKYDYVQANIILAKTILTEGGAYGKINGCFGGSAVENWILQNGGSFIDAARSFVVAAEGKSFEEFKESYFLWDFGQNHYSQKETDFNNPNNTQKEKFAYDNFVVTNLTENGYIKMVEVLKNYLVYLNNQEKEIVEQNTGKTL